jgi:hypothetical protein
MRRNRIARIIILVVIIGPIALFLFGSIVMWLWNNTLVPVLHVSVITFWQGLGILVLSKILFSSFGGNKGGYNHYFRKQRMMWNAMTPEQKEKFREEWKNRGRKWRYKNWEHGDETQQPESQV